MNANSDDIKACAFDAQALIVIAQVSNGMSIGKVPLNVFQVRAIVVFDPVLHLSNALIRFVAALSASKSDRFFGGIEEVQLLINKHTLYCAWLS